MKLDYDIAFYKDRTVKTEDGMTFFIVRKIGELAVPTGAVLACEPVVGYDGAAFTTRIPVGIYPVILSVAKFKYDERVAYAKLQISEKPSVRWEMAAVSGQDIDSLAADEVFGYPVDSGTGCFMDAETAGVFADVIDEDYAHLMLGEMDKNYTPTWSWADFKFNGTSGNLITFSTGFGDGVYASYFGFDKDDKIAALVTDFALFEELYFESNDDDYK